MEKFIDYLVTHKEELDRIEPTFFAEQAKERMEKRDLNPPIDPIFVDKVCQLFKQ